MSPNYMYALNLANDKTKIMGTIKLAGEIEKINPLALSRYLAQSGWTLFPFKRKDVQVYQYTRDKSFWQVMIPLDKALRDYKQTMFQTLATIAEVENKSIEQVMFFFSKL